MIPVRFLDILTSALVWASVVIVAFNLLKLAYAPLAIWWEVRARTWRRPTSLQARRASPPFPLDTKVPWWRFGQRLTRNRWRRQPVFPPDVAVSVIVPAYNEEVVLEACVESIVATRHPNLEVILVDDGSSDGTFAVMRELASRHSGVQALTQRNAGKGAALNTGIARASGKVLLFVDADGVFSADTIPWLLAGFDDEAVGAVCGDDRPANPDRFLTKLLSVISHVGTGLVRRALSLMHCLPIVSGNIGAFRADLVRELGGFNEETIGEDLELTWRVYREGFRVTFQPRAIVYAESPSTLRGLWRQRVRWARGLLQTVSLHRRMLGNPRYGVFGPYLAFNAATMILLPLLQTAVLVLLLVLAPTATVRFTANIWPLLAWLGLASALLMTLLAITLNGAFGEWRRAWTLIAWPLYSIFVGFTMVSAVVLELRRAPARWNKLQRTGVVTSDVLARTAGSRVART